MPRSVASPIPASALIRIALPLKTKSKPPIPPAYPKRKNESLTASLAGGGAADGAADNVIGLGAHSGIGSGGGVGAAVGSGAGSGNGDGGALSPFGVPGGGGGLGPKSPFMGISGNAHTIAYVCDASGSMLVKMVQLKDQLRTAVKKLQPVQSFSVIFFADPDVKPNALSQQLLIGPIRTTKSNSRNTSPTCMPPAVPTRCRGWN